MPRRCDGYSSFVQQFVLRKVRGWVKQIERLSKFAATQPHAAYAAFIYGLMSRWNFLLRVITWETLSSTELLQPLESAIQTQFIPAITGQASPREQIQELPALPVVLVSGSTSIWLRNNVLLHNKYVYH